MKNEDLLKDNIHLILNYHGRSIVVELKKYKTLVHIKEKVFELFYPVKNNIHIYSNNKNLETLINQPIGNIFSGKSIVSLKIIDEENTQTPFKLVNRYEDTFYRKNNLVSNYSKRYNYENLSKSNSISKENNKISKTSKINLKGNSNISLFKKSKLFLLKSEVNNDNNSNKVITQKKLNNNRSMDNIMNKKYLTRRVILPPIQIKNKNTNINIKKVSNKNNIKGNNKIKINDMNSKNTSKDIKIIYNKCNNCFINKISIYCRLCDKFLCNNCSYNKKSPHLEHESNFIRLNHNNNSENLNEYKKIIKKDLKAKLNIFKKYDKKEEENIEEDNNEKFSYDLIINNISNYFYKLVDASTDIKNSIKNLDESQNVNSNSNEIQSICNYERDILKKVNVYEYTNPFQPFFILNTHEKNMDKKLKNYDVNTDDRILVKSKIELMFQNVENEIDKTLIEMEKIIGNFDISEK